MIVNADLNPARSLRGRLEERVSFEVFQDSEESEIWKALEGGKDDVYVYDRCGRLAYYIPYPLSIMEDSNKDLVSQAIVSTYFTNVCGESCDRNDTITTSGENTTTIGNEVSPSNTTAEEEYINTNVTTPNTLNYFSENTASINESQAFEIEGQKNQSYSLGNKLFLDNSSSENTTSYLPSEISEISSAAHNSNDSQNRNHLFVAIEATTRISRSTSNKNRKNSDRCKEADVNVCVDYTKRRLLRIQKCCQNTGKPQKTSCQRFTPKRCKKYRTVLKCCIKTTIVEEESTTDDPTTEVVTLADVVCCRDLAEGRDCRISKTGICDEEGEYEEVPGRTEELITESSM